MLGYFISMLMLIFAVASIIAGIFTAYFGSGKSRAVGGILILIGLIVGVIFLWGAGVFTSFMGAPPEIIYFGSSLIWNSIAAVIGAIIGAVIALGLFLLAIMKA